MKDGLRPPVGPLPGVGNRLLTPPAEDGAGIPGFFNPDSIGLLGLVLVVGIDIDISAGGSPVTSAI